MGRINIHSIYFLPQKSQHVTNQAHPTPIAVLIKPTPMTKYSVEETQPKSKFSFMCDQFSDSILKLQIIKKMGRKINKKAKIDKKFQVFIPKKSSFFKYLQILFKILTYACLFPSS